MTGKGMSFCCCQGWGEVWGGGGGDTGCVWGSGTCGDV